MTTKKEETKKDKYATRRTSLSDEMKRSIIEDYIDPEKFVDLELNKDHLRQVYNKYGAYAYDILQMTLSCPKKLMNLALEGHDFSYNQIAQEFLANNARIDKAKALQFFAEAPVPLSKIEEIKTTMEMKAAEQIAKSGVKQSGGNSMAGNQANLENRMLARANTHQRTARTTSPRQTPSRDSNAR